MDNLSVEQLWHKEVIHKGVIQYLRNIGNEATWRPAGTISEMLQSYREREGVDDDWFVPNVINCWLSIGDGERDLSSLDLRKVSLSDHLKVQFTDTINIDGAWIAKETLINDRHHDRITGLCFSHDNRTMAAVSENGLVSITNLLTQSQMIIGELGKGINTQIGFDSDDSLIIRIGQRTYKWPTIAFDKIEEGNIGDMIELSSIDAERSKYIASLEMSKSMAERLVIGRMLKLSTIISLSQWNAHFRIIRPISSVHLLMERFLLGRFQMWETLRKYIRSQASMHVYFAGMT